MGKFSPPTTRSFFFPPTLLPLDFLYPSLGTPKLGHFTSCTLTPYVSWASSSPFYSAVSQTSLTSHYRPLLPPCIVSIGKEHRSLHPPFFFSVYSKNGDPDAMKDLFSPPSVILFSIGTYHPALFPPFSSSRFHHQFWPSRRTKNSGSLTTSPCVPFRRPLFFFPLSPSLH